MTNATDLALIAEFLRLCKEAAEKTGCHFEQTYDSVYVVLQNGWGPMVNIEKFEVYA